MKKQAEREHIRKIICINLCLYKQFMQLLRVDGLILANFILLLNLSRQNEAEQELYPIH